MPRVKEEPQEAEELEQIEVEPGPQPEAQEVLETMYGDAAASGADEEVIVRRLRNIISDAMNRHERFENDAREERSINIIVRDPYMSEYAALDEVDRARRRRDGVLLSHRSSFEAIRQELDTLQRTIKENRRMKG